MNAEALLQSALTHHQAGNLQEAAKGYQELLNRDPNNVNALYLLGCLAYQSGRQTAAIGMLRRAIALSPGQPQFYNALSLALLNSGQTADARAAIDTAIELDPQPQFWNTLGTLLRRQGESTSAIESFQQALQKEPSFNEARYNLGNAYRDSGNLGAAVSCFAAVVAREPNHLHSLAALAQCLMQAHRPSEAVPYLQRAVALAPDDLALRCELADALEAAGDINAAFALYEQCLEPQRGLPQTALAEAPFSRTWYGMGCICNAQKEFAQARLYFAAAVSLQPSWLEARHNLARSLFEMGHVSEAVRQFRLCGSSPQAAVSRAMLAVVIPGDPAATNADILDVRTHGSGAPLPDASKTIPADSRVKSLKSRLRIGYISAFFHRDPWMKPVWGLINSHCRDRFMIHLFSDCPRTDIKEAAYLPQADDRFHDTSALENPAVLELMKDAELDVLIDLNGYSSMRRLPLFFTRPAPVLVGWFNYYATSGLPAFDYLIGDDEVIPPSEEPFYTERILRVRGSYLTFQVHYPVPAVGERPKGDAFVFGCLGSQYKLTPEVIATWSRILQGAPGALLLIRNKVLASASARNEMVQRFAAHGIEPARLQLEGPASHFQFLETYARVDLALDTFPYNGGTTTTEAIWQGVPVVTFSGDRWVARTSASLLRAAGLGRFVAPDVDEYVSLAIRYGTEPTLRDELSALRSGMRKMLLESSACDVPSFTGQMEELLWSVGSGSPS